MSISAPTGTDALIEQSELPQHTTDKSDFYLPVPRVLYDQFDHALPRWRVVLYVGGQESQVIGLDIFGPVTLGRELHNITDQANIDLAPYQAAEHGVSRQHLELRPSPYQLLAVDLDSSNGTQKNGVQLQPNQPIPLADGDTLFVGTLEIKVKIVSTPQQQSNWFVAQASLGQALSEMAGKITGQLESEAVYATVIDYAISMTEAQSATLWAFEPDGKVQLLLARGVDLQPGQKIRPPLDTSIIGRCALTAEPLRLTGEESVSTFTLADDYVVDAAMLAPLTLGDRPLGVLVVSNQTAGHEFTEDDQSLLLGVANFAAIAIHNASLYETANQRAAELEALYQSSLSIISSLNLEEVLDEVLKAAASILPEIINASILSYQDQQLSVLGSWSEELHDSSPPFGDSAMSIAAAVAGQGTQVVMQDVNGELPYDGATPIWRGTIAGFPLKIRQQVVGVMVVKFSRSSIHLSEAEQQAFGLLSSQAAIAIENAGLFKSLQEADQLKEEMIQNISHEFRTPLTYITGYVGLMRDESQGMGPLTEEQSENLEIVATQTEKLMWLVENFVTLQSPKDIVQIREAVQVHSMLDKALAAAQAGATQAQIHLSVQCEADLPSVIINEKAVMQVLDNLLSNAIKFTPQDGNVALQATQEEAMVIVSVKDTGIGMLDEVSKSIFDRFYQVDGSSTRQYSGVGLGLSVCKAVIEAHGGSIWVDSQPGQGSTFSFSLPTS